MHNLPSTHSISVVVPVYNEEENIPFLLSAIKNTIPSIFNDFEIILIDDSSTDRTPEMLDAVMRREANIKVLHNRRNRTLGGSLRQGFKIAAKEFVLYFDADLPFDLKEINKALSLMQNEGADFISAYRINKNADGIRRLIYSYIYNKTINFLFGLELKDVNFSFKLFRRDLLETISLKSEGSFINVEMLVKIKMSGFNIMQFPVFYYPRLRGHSTLSSMRVILKILRELGSFYLWYHMRELQIKKQMVHLLAASYNSVPWWVRGYVYLRSRTCPFEKIEPYISREGRILDLGCGFGLFAIWLYYKSTKREITALDWQEKRIALARKVCENNSLRIKFVCADFNNAPFEAYDVLVIIDVLYLLPYDAQKELLEKCFAALNAGGRIVIKDMDVAPRLKYLWCLFQEFISTKIVKLNRSRNIHIIPKRRLVGFLTQLGLTVKIIRLDRGYWYSHIMYLCQKR